jgi:uncharacterized protein YjaZ
MAVTFHFLSASGALYGEFKTRVHAALEDCVQTCSAKLVLGDLDVVVMAAPKRCVIPQLGVRGYAYDAHQILLRLDPDHDSLAQNLEHRVSALLAHELHHCARSLACGGLTGTFGEALVSEGLACCFEEEIVGVTPFYAIECMGTVLRQFAAKVKAHVDVPYSQLPGGWANWMFGSWTGDAAFPYQCGYSTGYGLIRCWLDATRNQASSSAGIDPNVVITAWQPGEIAPFGC